jgi:class 3 adenylate cyclase
MEAKLVVQSPGHEDEEFLLGDALTIGRDPGCDVVFDQRYVSRVHARLERVGSGYQIVDCASTNGTLVNGRFIESATPLSNGDQIRIGDLEMQFREAAGGGTTILFPAGRLRSGEQRGSTLMTIVFTDVEDSTGLVQRLGDLAAREVLREHEMITRGALRVHGGSEVKTIGDGFLASFPSAARALQCAIAIQVAFEERSKLAESPLRVRVGVNAGEPLEEDDDIFGTAVILAARIAQYARGGEILVSNVVRELVAGRGFEFRDRGKATLKGFPEAVCLNELVWRTPA